MKKRYFTVIVLLIVLFLPLNACQSENIMYLLEYDTWSQFVIYNENNDGDATFYVLESPLEISTSYGKVVIETCYYEYNMGFVMNYTLKTNRPKEIEKMANDAEHSLYGKASVKGKTLDITSYGYNFNEIPDSDMVVFELYSGYKHTKKPSQTTITFEFLNESFEIQLTEKQGYSINTIQGKKLWDLYSNNADADGTSDTETVRSRNK